MKLNLRKFESGLEEYLSAHDIDIKRDGDSITLRFYIKTNDVYDIEFLVQIIAHDIGTVFTTFACGKIEINENTYSLINHFNEYTERYTAFIQDDDDGNYFYIRNNLSQIKNTDIAIEFAVGSYYHLLSNDTLMKTIEEIQSGGKL